MSPHNRKSRHTNIMRLKNLKQEALIEMKELEQSSLTGNKALDSLTLKQLKMISAKGVSSFNNEDLRNRIKNLSKLSDLNETIKFVDNYVDEHNFRTSIRTESELGVMDKNVSPSLNVAENVQDIEGVEAKYADAGDTKYTDQGQNDILSIGEFLSRPVQIANFQLSSSIYFNGSYNIWDLWSQVPSVRAKLRNFAYFKGDLNVQISLSGMPFHYGRMLVSYQPLNTQNKNLAEHQANLATASAWNMLFNNYLSQAPGSVTMDVRDNQPVTIHCPFICPKPMLRLFNHSSSAISAATSYDDFIDMGGVYFHTLNPIGSVSTTPSDVYCFIYAWASDVELGTSTATQIAITTESKKGKKDEREVGPVEHYSSGVANFLGHLSKVPYIGNFALASQMIAKGISGISSIFGWSKPTLIKQPLYVKNVGFQNGANTIGYDTNYKITLDPKQEITIDSTFLCDEDDMIVDKISGVETFITTFDWKVTDSIMVSPIFECGVTPMIGTYIVNTTSVVYTQPSAMQFAATPFSFWRGTIRFRFEVVCSAFHRGKIGFFYEPNIAQATLITAQQAMNKQFFKIIDIQETQTIEFDIGWAQTRAWARILDEGVKTYTPNFAPSIADDYDGWNGFIGVIPFTLLQSPDDSNVTINMYVSCDDLMVNYVTSKYFPDFRSVYTASQKGTSNVPVPRMELNQSSAETQTICLDFFGERPVSFRSLLKRYVTTAISTFGASVVTPGAIRGTHSMMPISNPNYGNTNTLAYRTLLTYLLYGYVGYRGGVRKRIRVYSDYTSQPLDQFRVSLVDADNLVNTYTSAADGNYQVSLEIGTVTMTPDSNAGVEVELPYYSINLFNLAFNDDPVGGGNYLFYQGWMSAYTFSLDTHGNVAAGGVIEDTAVSDDFSLMRFQGAPYFSSA